MLTDDYLAGALFSLALGQHIEAKAGEDCF